MSETKIFNSSSVYDTEAVGARLAELLSVHDTPAFIAMRGDLGAGKTAFVRGFASVLSPSSRVKSPTYNLVNEYRRGARPLFHFDLYRGGDPDTLDSIGFDDYCAAGDVIIEWSENMHELPKNAIIVTIEKLSENERKIIIENL